MCKTTDVEPWLCVCVFVSSDGKLYDAYLSYVNNDYDRKFVNFILKPHLENKHGYKLHLNDNDILPGAGKITLLFCSHTPFL